MGRRVRTNVPQIAQQFVPEWPYLEQFKAADKRYNKNQKKAYDTRRVQSLPELDDDLPVWVNIQNGQVPGTIVRQANTPRLYHVNVPSGQVRRNRRHRQPCLQPSPDNTGNQQSPGDPPDGVRTRSRTGVTIHHPDRLA